MTIIRDHSYLFVCLAAACGGARDPSNLAFQEHDRAVTAATADSPRQAEIVCANKVVFFGRSSAPAGASVTATSFDSRRVPRTCTGAVLKDQTWSCQQTLADGGYTWTAQVGSGGPVSQQVDFVVNTARYPAPTIDHTPSPNSDPKPILTGTVSSQLVNRGFYLEVTEHGEAICIVSPIRSTNWACPLSSNLAEGSHTLSVDVDESDGDEATPSGNSNAFTVKTRIGNPTLAAVPTPTSSTRIPFSGTGEPGAVITVAQGTTVLCQTTVSMDRAWACISPQALGDGDHDIAATQRDAAGNVSDVNTAKIPFKISVPTPPWT